MTKNLPQVALIGRTNVGKSTLFNRLVGRRQALISPEPGTTRDRNFGIVNWLSREFELVDTGGLDLGYLPKTKLPKKLHLSDIIDPENLIETSIVKQATIALKQADLILVVVDGKIGLQQEDRTVTNILRQAKKPYLLVANKIDKKQAMGDIWEFSALGLGQPIPVSAANGSGTGDLLDLVVKKLKFPRAKKTVVTEPTDNIKLAIIGRPNVGKSSILNSILGEERVIVSPIAHTTRESQEAEFFYQDQHFILVDTAGIRRQAKVGEGLEKSGIADTRLSLKEADVALLVLEANQPITYQDRKLAQEIIDSHCGLILVGNKWDLVPDKTPNKINQIAKYFYSYFPALAWAPFILVSAKTNQRVKKILDLTIEIKKELHKKITEKELEKLLKKAIRKHLPAQAKGASHPYIYSLKQLDVRPPKFELLIHPKAEIHFSYLRYLENQIRKNFGFTGVPLIIKQKFYKK